MERAGGDEERGAVEGDGGGEEVWLGGTVQESGVPGKREVEEWLCEGGERGE